MNSAHAGKCGWERGANIPTPFQCSEFCYYSAAYRNLAFHTQCCAYSKMMQSPYCGLPLAGTPLSHLVCPAGITSQCCSNPVTHSHPIYQFALPSLSSAGNSVSSHSLASGAASALHFILLVVIPLQPSLYQIHHLWGLGTSESSNSNSPQIKDFQI